MPSTPPCINPIYVSPRHFEDHASPLDRSGSANPIDYLVRSILSDIKSAEAFPEEDNAKLKRLVADLSVDKAILQDALSKKSAAAFPHGAKVSSLIPEAIAKMLNADLIVGSRSLRANPNVVNQLVLASLAEHPRR